MKSLSFVWLAIALCCAPVAAQLPSAPTQQPEPLRGSLVIVGGGAMPDTVTQAFLKLAGAAVMSKLMIANGPIIAKLGEGFGFIPGIVVDQHFLKRNRVNRLLDVLGKHPGWAGLGIDEQTAVIAQGRTMTVVGESCAMV